MKSLVLIFFISLSFLACKKDTTVLTKGQITGVDLRMCACCGGWYIKIDTTTYRFLNLPANNNLDLSHATFPLAVQLQWKKDLKGCVGDEIIVEYIKKE